ncbi:MAG: hypothetical protein ISR65_12185 [Bacteriovoracaceae bacterium]|nr:hypothetical protein [Bacteriovoracaceae bacterium]
MFNVFKPAGITSYDVVRHFKKNLNKLDYGKIGHFGTLDPFASGVLLLGVGGATKINEYVHKLLPKTYLAVGKLGVHTDTGDQTVPPSQQDNSDYIKDVISKFDQNFIEQKLRSQFIGEYLQAPHKFSAAKHCGVPLHKWARANITVKKEPKKRVIHNIEVVKYKFPYLSIRFTVSSGTYIRTLFSDCAKYLGTLGVLVALVRESIGEVDYKDSLKKGKWPNKIGDKYISAGDYLPISMGVDEVLPLEKVILSGKAALRYMNGIAQNLQDNKIQNELLHVDAQQLFWVYQQTDSEMLLIGMGKIKNLVLYSVFNFQMAS